MNVLDYRFPSGEGHWKRLGSEKTHGIESSWTGSLRMILTDGFGKYAAYSPDEHGPTFFSNVDDARTVIERLDAQQDKMEERRNEFAFVFERTRYTIRTFNLVRVLTEPVRISVGADFSRTPGGRYKRQGPWSGEEFRETLLEPHFDGVLKPHSDGPKLIVDLDGTEGYSAGFLEEAFGGLIRKFGIDAPRRFRVKSDEEPELIDEIWKYVTDACRLSREGP